MAAWVDNSPILWLALVVLLCMAAAATLGWWTRRLGAAKRSDPDNAGQEAYIVSAVLGLLALLMGFTLSLSLDRFETRRALVLKEANAIGTAYLRTQLLEEPHRGRLTGILVAYLDNRLAYASAATSDERGHYLRADDQLMVDMWAAAAAAFDDNRIPDFSTVYLDSVNAVLDLDTSRRTAQASRVPVEVFGMLFFFVLVAAGMLGFVLTGRRRLTTAGFLLVLMALALTLMLDIDRPSAGWVMEPQAPLEVLRDSISAQQPEVYDKWRKST